MLAHRLRRWANISPALSCLWDKTAIESGCSKMGNSESQKAVTAYLKSKQLQPFGFPVPWEILQGQKAVTAYLKSKQILPFRFVWQGWLIKWAWLSQWVVIS